jgi:hypothetical protein
MHMRRWAMGGLVAATAVGIYWWHSQPEPVNEGPRRDDQKVDNHPARIFEGKELARQQLLGSLALASGQGFPASLPWKPLHHIGTSGLYPLESLLHHQPVLFLEWCQTKYTSEVKGYTCIFCKQERVKGKLLPAEKIEVHFREEPFSVHMHFLQGGSAKKVVYPDGDNHDNLAARPNFPSFILVSRAIKGAEAMQNSRFPINQFGIQKGAESTLASMHRAQARGALHLRYDGVYKVPQLGDRTCHKFVRTPYTPHEDDDLNELTVYIDTETWLQVGSVLKTERDELIAEYWFRDVKLNPDFDDDQFTRKAL